MSVTIHEGDCRAVLAAMDADSVDSVVTDPPYHLTSIVKRFGASDAAPVKPGATGAYVRASRGFMGKVWDGGDVAFQPETWAAVLRVMKPGAHLIAFGGDRTEHRLKCAIEDAGFEIRGTLVYLFGNGFPKSHNVGKKLDATKERCSCGAHMPNVRHRMEADDALSGRAQQDVRSGLFSATESSTSPSEAAESSAEHFVRDVRQVVPSATVPSFAQRDPALQSPVLGGDAGRASALDCAPGAGSQDAGVLRASSDARLQEPGMEGRRYVPQASGQLRQRAIRALPAGISDDGTSGRLCDGAQTGDGTADRPAPDANGGGASHRPPAAQQRSEQSRTVALQPQPQDGRAWELCERCGKPRVPDGLGTALKPAAEFICLARKPLVGTVAANVLEHGTGALNIDASRIATADGYAENAVTQGINSAQTSYEPRRERRTFELAALGRWPANVLHDGSDEVLEAFAAYDAPGQQRAVTGAERSHRTKHAYGDFGRSDGGMEPRSDIGSAARFFYSAKADASDRLGSKHPTVKPVDLMRYLVKLITPPGGLVLDPFAGTGTTGMAARMEGFRAVLIEREAEYVADIKRRIGHMSGADTPLFGGSDAPPATIGPPDLRSLCGRTIGPIGLKR